MVRFVSTFTSQGSGLQTQAPARWTPWASNAMETAFTLKFRRCRYFDAYKIRSFSLDPHARCRTETEGSKPSPNTYLRQWRKKIKGDVDEKCLDQCVFSFVCRCSIRFVGHGRSRSGRLGALLKRFLFQFLFLFYVAFAPVYNALRHQKFCHTAASIHSWTQSIITTGRKLTYFTMCTFDGALRPEELRKMCCYCVAKIPASSVFEKPKELS